MADYFTTTPQHVAIVGTRLNLIPLDLRPTMQAKVESFVAHLPPGTTVISGGAAGVDTWAEEAAKARTDLPDPVIFRVTDEEWQMLGTKAGPLRNEKIVLYLNEKGGKLFAFACINPLTGLMSTGTAGAILLCTRHRVPFKTFKFGGRWSG